MMVTWLKGLIEQCDICVPNQGWTQVLIRRFFLFGVNTRDNLKYEFYSGAKNNTNYLRAPI